LETTDTRRAAPFSNGIVRGRLSAYLEDSIRVGEVVLVLPEGMICNHRIGTVLQVSYTKHGGISVRPSWKWCYRVHARNRSRVRFKSR